MHCLQAFSSKEILTKQKENFLSINGIQGIQMPKKAAKQSLKIIIDRCPFHLSFMRILRRLLKKCQDASQVKKNHEQTNINTIQHVAMGIKLCAIMTTNSQNQNTYEEARSKLISFYTRCLKKWNIARPQCGNISKSYW